jgi:hypothetical protein
MASQLAVVFLTVFSGTVTYVAGQLALKMVVEPVQDLKKTIGVISHSLIERANVIYNPGLSTNDVNGETSRELRKLASRLRSHLYLIPSYSVMAGIFRLPLPIEILTASKSLIGLSNGVHAVHEDTHRSNARDVKTVCDSLRIYNEP